MTALQFQFDGQSLTQDLGYAPERANPAVLEETYFIMPVRFCIDDIELFEQSRPHPDERNSWLPLPVLGFATHALQALREIEPNSAKQVSLAGCGTLSLRRQDDRLSVTSSINGKTATATFAEIRDAFDNLCDEVRQMLVKHVPALQKHSFWPQWFGTPIQQ